MSSTSTGATLEARSTRLASQTLAVLGCGTLGTAILSGILTAIYEPSNQSQNSQNAAKPATEEVSPASRPQTFLASVRREESAKRIEKTLGPLAKHVQIIKNDNVATVKDAGIVILGCKPYMVNDILAQPGLKEALAGKLLISICAGVTVEHLEKALYGEVIHGDPLEQGKCRAVRAMPNTAAGIRESMTVIATSVPPLSPETNALITWIFKQIGDVVHLPANTMDASTALCGSGPAFFALMLEASIDGAVAMGLPRAEAQRMAAQTMRGAAGMVLNGEHPAILRDKVTTPGGCTIGGLLVLEEGTVRGTISRAVREATVVASQLGKGVQGVNGTRF